MKKTIIPFKKMHGAGNDFIVIKFEDFPYLENLGDFAIQSCHRHFGIGADGILVVAPSTLANTKMIYYNSDGSLANMCGNGIRCFAKYVFDEGLIKENKFTVETLAGILKVNVTSEDNKAIAIKVHMGKMNFNPKEIPVVTEKEHFIQEKLEIAEESFEITTVLMGVPHTVVFTDDLNTTYVKKYGPLIEKHHLFPQKTNVNFAKVIDRSTIIVKTWERGAGYTLACGTGVTSVCGIAHYLGYIDEEVMVEIDGGRLFISIADNGDIYMEGPAANICEGNFFLEE